ncbi:hypothetical protein C8R47DRAFT_1097650 [Mycena vitilis]|nr:hypothetical protein C8R47DRAFT_1097650 [Mycena vitilis]
MERDTKPVVSQRVEELWFEDGNLVIQAGNSLYRVFRGILAARSPIFQDMLCLPQPSDSELVEGCPLVCIQDQAVEVTSFLRAIFDSSFFMPHPAPTDFNTLVGVLRLSHKYGVDYLRRRALVHLSSGYRTTLSSFDKVEYYGDPNFNPNSPASEIHSWVWPADNSAHQIASIQLAREVEAPWVLPHAFHDLAVGYSELGRDVFHGVVCNGVSVNLALEDQQLFAEGHVRQLASTTGNIAQFFFNPREILGCTSSQRCFSERIQAMESNWENFHLNASIPLGIWGTNHWKSLQNLCPACLAGLKKIHQDARQTFWDKLPEIYGLPGWEELKRLKTAAIGADLFC